MNAKAIFAAFVSRISGKPRPSPEREALMLKLNDARRRTHTQGVGKARKAIQAALIAELRQYVGGRNASRIN
jgi:hypothetical protein